MIFRVENVCFWSANKFGKMFIISSVRYQLVSQHEACLQVHFDDGEVTETLKATKTHCTTLQLKDRTQNGTMQMFSFIVPKKVDNTGGLLSGFPASCRKCDFQPRCRTCHSFLQINMQKMLLHASSSILFLLFTLYRNTCRH